jgi:hypothetical protein
MVYANKVPDSLGLEKSLDILAFKKLSKSSRKSMSFICGK